MSTQCVDVAVVSSDDTLTKFISSALSPENTEAKIELTVFTKPRKLIRNLKRCAFDAVVLDGHFTNKLERLLKKINNAQPNIPTTILTNLTNTTDTKIACNLRKANCVGRDLESIIRLPQTILSYESIQQKTVTQNTYASQTIHERPETPHAKALIISSNVKEQLLLARYLAKHQIHTNSANSFNCSINLDSSANYDLIFVADDAINAKSEQPFILRRKFAKSSIITITNPQSEFTAQPMVSFAFDASLARPISKNDLTNLVEKYINNPDALHRNQIDQIRSVCITEIMDYEPNDQNQPESIDCASQLIKIISEMENLVELISSAAKESKPDLLRQLATQLRNSTQKPEQRCSVSALEQLVLSFITAKQLQQTRDFVHEISQLDK